MSEEKLKKAEEALLRRGRGLTAGANTGLKVVKYGTFIIGVIAIITIAAGIGADMCQGKVNKLRKLRAINK